MPKLVKDGALVADTWTVVDSVESTDELNGEHLIVPAQFWLQNLSAFSHREDLGVWLSGEDEVGELSHYVEQLPLIAIHFPGFMDGRGFSLGRLLRERYHFAGELRAIGNFMRDQMAYLRRCGFNAFSLSNDIDAEGAIRSLNSFSEYYQAAVDQPLPLFRRRAS